MQLIIEFDKLMQTTGQNVCNQAHLISKHRNWAVQMNLVAEITVENAGEI